MVKRLLLALSLLSLTACNVNPSQFGEDEAKSFASKIVYVKDNRTNLCFGLVASRKTGEFDQSGMGMSLVPCEAVQSLLVQ